MIRIGNVKNDFLNLENLPVFVPETIGNQTAKYRIYENDILFTMTGTKGKRDYFFTTVVTKQEKILLLNQRVGCLRSFSTELNMNYLSMLLKGKYILDSIFSTETGNVSQGNIGSENTLNLFVALPPYVEQQRIVKKVNSFFDLLNVMEERKRKLQDCIHDIKVKILDLAIHGKLVPQDPNDEPASELLKRINPKAEITCDNPQYGKLPNGWCETLLGNIGTWQSGATPSRLRKEYYGGSIPWLKTGDLNDGIVQSIPECITERALEETSVKLNPAGSILIAMYGATIGRIGILSKPATTNQACCACVDYLPEKKFLFYFLLANRENFIAMGGGGAQPNISKEKIIHTHIPLPPQQEQQRIVAKIEELFAQLDNITSSL